MVKKKKDNLVASFMNLPSGDESMFLKDPLSIKKIIENLSSEWVIGDQESPEKTISEKWHRIVGNGFASKCAPDKLIPKGTLYIKAANAVVKQELSFEKKIILKRINKLKGCGFIKQIKII